MIRTIIVEDESWIRKGIIGAIDWAERGLELVGEADNGEEALRMMAGQQVDLLFVDMRMPRMDGVELLRKLEEAGADCEIVVLSGYSDFAYMKQAITSQVFAYLLKPVDIAELNEVLRKVSLRWHEKRRERESREQRQLQAALLAELAGGIDRREAEAPDVDAIGDAAPGAASPAGAGREAGGAYPWSGTAVCVMAVRATEGAAGQWNGYPADAVLASTLPEFRVFTAVRGAELLLLCSAHGSATARLKAMQRQLAVRLVEDFRSRFHLETRVGIGNWREHGREIAQSCEEACRALQFERMPAGGPVFFDALRREASSELPVIAEERTIVYLLDNRLETELIGLAETFFAERAKETHVYIPAVRAAVVEFAHTLGRSLRQCGMEWLLPALHAEDMLTAVDALHSLSGLRRWTLEKAAGAAQTIARRQTRPDLIQEVKAYIDFHYADDIRLIRLAQKFYVNHIYLSRLFKQTTGENFIDYLTRIRMHKAKELMAGGGLGVHQVAELVGYQNPYYFSKAYRKFFAVAGEEAEEE